MQVRKPLIAVSLSFLVIIGGAGCGGGGSAPSAGTTLSGGDSGSTAGNASAGAGSSAGGSAAAGATATDGSATTGSVAAGSTSTASSGGTSSTGVAKLSWDPTLPGAAGFKVYYGTSPRSYSTTINVGMVPGYALSGLAPGTYYFAVTAYDAAGNESVYSNEASKTI